MKVIKERHMRKWGYVIKDELIEAGEYGTEKDFLTQMTYTPSGDYIGNKKMAAFLCKRRGIKPEYKTKDSNVCSIGFSEKNNKWYGWSHRAIAGFTIGSTCTKGDCHYVPSTPQELYNSVTAKDDDGWAWFDQKNVELTETGVKVKHDIVIYTNEDPITGELTEPINNGPEYQFLECGKGEWVAETMDDAKQMAKDFAESVS